MTLATPQEVIAWLDGMITRPPDVFHLLPPRLRQIARYPYMAALMDELGHPEAALRVAHIGGTSGKGSTATLLEAMARAAGVRTGLYTSPYVTMPQERVQIDGVPIADDLFVASANEVLGGLARFKARLPHFEPHLKMVWVALALVAFARAGVELAVIEVGKGGRYDETNVVHPSTATIVSVGFDHMASLGDSLPEIAFHKAGIIKEGASVINGVTEAEPRGIIAAEAGLSGSPLQEIDTDFGYEAVQVTAEGTDFDYVDGQDGGIADCRLRLIGRHYGHNAALAIRTMRTLYPATPVKAIRRGLHDAWLPGRFEIIGDKPRILLDVAHNPDKLNALVETMLALYPATPLWLVVGLMASKDAAHMLPAIARLHPQAVLCTEPTMVNRAVLPAGELAAGISAIGLHAKVARVPAEAVARAVALAGRDGLVVITGSLYLVSEVRAGVVAANG
jgi:dihydrofolate synthase/folylpolyglutamate synthase